MGTCEWLSIIDNKHLHVLFGGFIFWPLDHRGAFKQGCELVPKFLGGLNVDNLIIDFMLQALMNLVSGGGVELAMTFS
jgi:hypothetical protein